MIKVLPRKGGFYTLWIKLLIYIIEQKKTFKNFVILKGLLKN